jgi:hypothetical protein
MHADPDDAEIRQRAAVEDRDAGLVNSYAYVEILAAYPAASRDGDFVQRVLRPWRQLYLPVQPDLV